MTNTEPQPRTAEATKARIRAAARRRHLKWISELREYGYTVTDPPEAQKG